MIFWYKIAIGYQFARLVVSLQFDQRTIDVVNAVIREPRIQICGTASAP